MKKVEQTKTISGITYSIAGTLMAGEWLDVLDRHAAAFGVLLGMATFTTNFIFNWLSYRAVVSGKGDRRKSSH